MSNYSKSDFSDRKIELNSNYGYAYTITKSDSAILSPPTRGIYVGGAGDVAVVLWGNEDSEVVVFKAVPVGTLLPIRVRKVMSTNTTATLLIGLL